MSESLTAEELAELKDDYGKPWSGTSWNGLRWQKALATIEAKDVEIARLKEEGRLCREALEVGRVSILSLAKQIARKDELLRELTDHERYQLTQDEQGGCVWCCSRPPDGSGLHWDDFPLAGDHAPECPYRKARAELEASHAQHPLS